MPMMRDTNDARHDARDAANDARQRERDLYRCRCKACDKPTGSSRLGLWCTRCDEWWHIVCVRDREQHPHGGPARAREAKVACAPGNEEAEWLCPRCWTQVHAAPATEGEGDEAMPMDEA